MDRDHEIKPFSCKYCDKSFLHVHEVKKHIEIYTSTSEVEEEKTKGATKNCWLLDHKIQEKKDHERKKPLNCTNSSPSKNNENTEIPTTSSKSVQDLIINTSPKHICGTCGKSFVSGRNLRVHIKNVHKGKKHIENHTSTSKVKEGKTKGATKNSGIKINFKKADKSASMEPVMPSPLVGSLECNYCNKGFSTISNMN